MTDRYCIRAVHRAPGAAGLRPLALPAMALYTRQSKDRVRDAVDFVELVGARTELRRAGPARYEGLCPFHDERTPSFGIDPDAEGLLLLRLPGLGRRVHVRAGDRGRGLQRARWSCWPSATAWSCSSSRRIRARPSAGRRASGCSSCSAARRPTTSATCGSPRRRRGRASTWPGAGWARRSLREFRVGYAPSAWDRVLLASRRGGFSSRELYDAGLAQRSRAERPPVRPLPLADHVPAGGHARAGARLRRARDARGRSDRST